jgi:hypothetical protein
MSYKGGMKGLSLTQDSPGRKRKHSSITGENLIFCGERGAAIVVEFMLGRKRAHGRTGEHVHQISQMQIELVKCANANRTGQMFKMLN